MDKKQNNKVYLGDSVYASNDGFHVILSVDNGLGSENLIYIEASVFLELVRYGNELFGIKNKQESDV